MQVLFSLFSTYTENLPSPGTPTFFFFFFFCVNFFPGLNYLSPFVTHLSRGAQWESCVVTRPHVVVTPRRDEGAEEKREKIGRKNIHTRLFNRGTPRETFLSLLCSRTSSAGMLDRVTRGESWLRNFIPGNFRVLGEELAFKARGSRYETLPSHGFFAHSFPPSPYLKASPPLLALCTRFNVPLIFLSFRSRDFNRWSRFKFLQRLEEFIFGDHTESRKERGSFRVAYLSSLYCLTRVYN